MKIEYRVNPNRQSFQQQNNTVYLGGTGYDRLTDKEQDILISDALTHEFMHILLDSMFTYITSSLYDFIGDKLLNTVILNKVMPNDATL